MKTQRSIWRHILVYGTAGFLLAGAACDFSRIGEVDRDPEPDPGDPDTEAPGEPPTVTLLSPVDGDTITGSRLDVRVATQGDAIDRIIVRLSGALDREETHDLQPAVVNPDTVITVSLRGADQGEVQVRAAARTSRGHTGESEQVTVLVEEEVGDTDAPEARFSIEGSDRPRRDEAIRIVVDGEGFTEVVSVGLTVVATDRGGVAHNWTGSQDGASGAFEFTPADLGVPVASDHDTGWRSLVITAHAIDAEQRCGAAVNPGRFQAFECAESATGIVAANRTGHTWEIMTARDFPTTQFAGDVLADIDSDGTWAFVSNLSRNRVEYRALSALGPDTGGWSSQSAGSEPWGLSVADGVLHVANSGGTNISRMQITPSGLAREAVSDRIFLPHIRMYFVDASGEVSVTRHTYSDRPQFLAVAESGRIFYSTKPTGAAPDGTIRTWRDWRGEGRVNLFIQYPEITDVDNYRFLVANADSVNPYIFFGDDGDDGGNGDDDDEDEEEDLVGLRICARNLHTGGTDCHVGMPHEIVRMLRDHPDYDVEFAEYIDPEDIALQDTTYVARSGDRRHVVFGEGNTQFGSVLAFSERGDGTVDQAVGNTRDLTNNAAERVSGVALNSDGSLGAARGDRAYMFTRPLRLQGFAEALAPTGGIALHPSHAGYPAQSNRDVAFVPGVDGEGRAFLDIVDTFSFLRTRRLPLARVPTGGMIAVPFTTGGAEVRLVGIAGDEVVVVDLYPEDF